MSPELRTSDQVRGKRQRPTGHSPDGSCHRGPSCQGNYRQGESTRGYFDANFLISINQIDLCHTSNISSKGWFIHLFEKIT